MQLSPEELQQESDNVELLVGMMGGDGDPEIARKVLRKNQGNVEKAADAMLAGDRGEETTAVTWHSSQATQESTYSNAIIPATPAPPSSVIDLTGDDDDYNRAVQLSMETSQTEVKFGPSERAPDPAWQMVPSNVPVGTNVSQEDQHLNEAIQASLNDFAAEDTDDFPSQEAEREGGRPVALRPELPALAYAALVIQALFFVPQVRSAVANLHLPSIDENLPHDSPEPARAMWNLVELFTHMEYAQLATIVDAEVLPSLEAPLFRDNLECIGDIASTFIKDVGKLIEMHVNHQKPENEPDIRLFTFTHGHVKYFPEMPRKFNTGAETGCVAAVNVGGDDNPHNDLISCLAVNLSRYEQSCSSHDVILEPSEMVGFQIKRLESTATTGKAPADPLVYPKSIFLDQFLFENIGLVNDKRARERQIHAETRSLIEQKELLTQSDNKDVLKNLRASIHYYEYVAQSKGDLERQKKIEYTAAQLKTILSSISSRVEDIDHRIESLKAELAGIFDCPELQNHQYDLRAVLMHTGLPGRKQIYSYVQDLQGTWWKTVDYTVTEIPEETVLTDSTGLHLNAGPFLLLYSRHLSDEQLKAPVTWPRTVVDMVEENNRTFLASLSVMSSQPMDVDPAVSSRSRGVSLDSLPEGLRRRNQFAKSMDIGVD